MKAIIIMLLVLFTVPVVIHAEGTITVSRAQFTTGISDHEPVDAPETIPAGQQTVYFFTEIQNASGQSVTHKWYDNDTDIADVELQVGTDRWRTWSTKQVWHLAPGTLKVEVVDAAGNLLVEKEIPIQ